MLIGALKFEKNERWTCCFQADKSHVELAIIQIVEHSRYKEALQFRTARDVIMTERQQHFPWLPAQAAANQFRLAANPQNSSAQTAEKSRLNAMENAANSAAYTSAQNAVSQDHKGEFKMGSVIVTYKVFPEDIVQSFDALKKRLKAISPSSHQLKDTVRNQ